MKIDVLLARDTVLTGPLLTRNPGAILPRVKTLVAEPCFEGITLDVSGQKWLQQANLDNVTHPEVIATEEILDAQLPQRGLAFIYVGRNRFKLVPAPEAELYRTERLTDWHQERSKPKTIKGNCTDLSLQNCAIFAGPASASLGHSIA